jgi:2-amino-4-hydroxy-6-hydroxymethyldihydropteridine diphosphokinase
VRYWIGLGANLGDRAANLRRAAAALGEVGALRARSRIYESAPVGGPPQPPYYNAAIVVDSDLEPLVMLRHARGLERALGRIRDGEVRFGPRVIDVDLLLAGDHGEVVFSSEELGLPHPRLVGRAFALAGLVELDPALMHPVEQRSLRDLLTEAEHAGAATPTEEAL